jgi:hypothetical protein
MKMTALRHLFPLLVAIFVLAIAAASAINGASPDTSRAYGAEQPPNSELTGGWHLVRTRHPQGGPDAVSIMHTADISKSDLDLAGLMLRCGDGGTEILVVLIRPFPLRARPKVAFGKSGSETHFDTSVVAPGTAILLPQDAATLVNGPWRSLSELFIQVDDEQVSIRGVVALTGLKSAFDMLMTNCRVR